MHERKTPASRLPAMTDAPALPSRRTQQERSAATQAALLDAAIDCLIDHGYANTTTSRVAERAGLSRGAHLHHFQTRAVLVAAAVERFAARRIDELQHEIERLPRGPDRTLRALDLLWRLYSGPLFQAAVDLFAAARTDADLRASLVRFERVIARETVRLCRDLFLDQADRPDFAQVLELVLSTIRGLALLDTVQPGSSAAEQQWRYCRAQLQAMLELPSAAS
ncbi:TetR/AcrR family transcriptional regulator [Thermoleophilia bacterium SCSIO 60948]|nr:TetR/AcrR family transcriptional regulator [Thermoleophilia bacterium SCSIO 60948]